MLRFVHLSDIHFGQETSGQKVPYQDLRGQLIADAKQLSIERGECDGILVAGDIAYQGTSANYLEASQWLDELASAVNCDRSAVCIVPGNHDVNRAEITSITSIVHDAIRKDKSQSQELLARLADENTENHPLLKTQSAYQKFAEQYDCPFESSSKPMWQKYFQIRSGNYICVIGMNSSQVSNRSDSRGDLILGNRQFTISPASAGIVQIVMMHHPFSWLMDGTEAKRMLYERSRIFITGHEHDTSIEKIITGQQQQILHLASGAVTPPGGISGGNKFSYNWIELDVEELNGGLNLRLQAIPRVWRTGTAQFALDNDVMPVGASCIQFEVPCPTFGSSISIPQAVNCKNSQANNIAVDDLRVSFWRLNDKERLSILLDLNLLPDNFNGALSIALERIAFQKAHNEGLSLQLKSAISAIIGARSELEGLQMENNDDA